MLELLSCAPGIVAFACLPLAFGSAVSYEHQAMGLRAKLIRGQEKVVE